MVCMLTGENSAVQYITRYLKHCFPLIPVRYIGFVNNRITGVFVITVTFVVLHLRSEIVTFTEN